MAKLPFSATVQNTRLAAGPGAVVEGCAGWVAWFGQVGWAGGQAPQTAPTPWQAGAPSGRLTKHDGVDEGDAQLLQNLGHKVGDDAIKAVVALPGGGGTGGRYRLVWAVRQAVRVGGGARRTHGRARGARGV